ncbi:bacterial Ig-like domain-containing protein [Demequina sp. SO4-13]|uniref:bacterial Ig-like domain-containing protein n=1 Tax=Demequina sp. SO4-13 TaxID=3401027 RepID=UPI003AF44808
MKPKLIGAGALIGALVASAGLIPASAAIEEEPGATMRTYHMPPGMTELCTLKSGQTPNVDRLISLIDLESEEEFGGADDFVTHVTATLTVPEDGDYDFRLTSDDGSAMHINGEQIIDNDGLHGTESVDGTVTLTAGEHDLFVEFFEQGGGQRLLLEWSPPGAAGYEIVPTSVLGTEAGVVRVTAPGLKYCEGATDTAGDGLRLDSVNPNYDLIDLRPEGFEPKVSGMAFDGDGELVISTTGSVNAGGWVPDAEPGEVFLVEGATTATGPDDVTVTKLATDLLNPMGVDVIGDSIFVSERHQLTELTDPDGDGFYDTHTTLADWPDGGNFHEFAFGLIHDENNFYVNLSVAIDNGGATTDPQPAENRGTTLAIDRVTGDVSYIAGGLRTPNGIAFGPDGELFAMDNQGGWLPSSKLVHVEQDRFFNHYMNPAGPFDSNPVTPPALWLPQNEIGNSPSTPILVEQGDFAGQMLFGDVTYGGVQRTFLELVDGEYQGAAFRHTAGLEVGVNRVIAGPDGALYIGGTGEGGNWGESGKLNYGLQKLAPVSEDTFDMKEMRVVEGGFEIEYTEAISDETAANIAESYSVKQWSYTPTSNYGGPKIGEETLFVTDATVSTDSTTVTLDIEGLEPGHVVYVRSPRPFESASAKELYSTEAWYTLNSLPGYVAPPEDHWYEAEEGALQSGAFVDTGHNGFSGVGFMGGTANEGAATTITVNVDEAGTHPVNVRYANGPHPFEGDKSWSLYVNGEDRGDWVFPSTGEWNQWATVTRDIVLDAGTNTIQLKFDPDNDGSVNFDALSIGANPEICAPAQIEDGYTSLFDGTLASFEDWSMAGAGAFARQDDCSLVTYGGMGLLWHPGQQFTDYSLKLDWKLVDDHNGGVFVGFPNPGTDPWVAVNEGYEIQIDASDEEDRTTGAIYTFQGADNAAVEQALNPVGQWNGYEIVVEGETIKIYLNGTLVNDFTSTDPARDLTHGFIGVQNHGAGESVFYRNIRIQEIEDPDFVAESIEVTQLPSITDYVVGDELNLEGLTVMATSTDSETSVVTSNEYTVTGFDSSTAGDVTLTVTYDADPSITTTFDVTVYAENRWLEAEDSMLLGSAGTATEHNGYSGTGFVDGIQEVGAGVSFAVTVDETGAYPVNVRYANGPNPFDGDKSLSLFVNDEDRGDWVFPRTGAWNQWATVTRVLDLNAGANTIQLSYEDGDDGNVNLDLLSVGGEPVAVESLDVTQLPSRTDYVVGGDLDLDGLEVTSTWTDSETVVLTEDEFTVSGFDSSTAGDVTLTVTYDADPSITTTFDVTIYAENRWYEMEEGELASGAKIDTEHSGYSGAGFVGGIWEEGASATITVNVDEAGTYPVNVRYANGPNPFDGDKSMSLFVNGEDQGDWVFPRTGAWNQWATVSRDIDLGVGDNTIELSFEAGDDGNVNFDVLSVGEGQVIPDPVVESIEVTQLPTKTDYMVGDDLDLDSLKAPSTWTDSATSVLVADEFMVTGFASSAAGGATLTVTYAEDTSIMTSFDVTVSEVPATVESIEVTQLPTKTDYMVGDDLDLDGLEATATWTDSATSVLAADEFTVTGFDSSAAGGVTRTVTYDEDTSIMTSFDVTVSEVPVEVDFTDVPESLEHFESIMWLADQGITNGWVTEDGTEFRPFANITRDAMAAFLYRYAGEPEVTLPSESPFVDITPTNTEFYEEIVWLAQEGISTGWTVNGEQEFRPFEPITRDAIAAFLYRYAGEPEWTDPVESPFSDITSENTEFYTEITWLESTGITEGWVENGEAEFRPFNETTRDAFAAFLNRFHNNVEVG